MRRLVDSCVLLHCLLSHGISISPQVEGSGDASQITAARQEVTWRQSVVRATPLFVQRRVWVLGSTFWVLSHFPGVQYLHIQLRQNYTALPIETQSLRRG